MAINIDRVGCPGTQPLRTTRATRVIITAIAAAVALSGTMLAAQKPAAKGAAAPAKPGIYSDAQAQRGEALYADNCSYCHLVDLSGGDLAPALTGPPFTGKWSMKPV